MAGDPMPSPGDIRRTFVLAAAAVLVAGAAVAVGWLSTADRVPDTPAARAAGASATPPAASAVTDPRAAAERFRMESAAKALKRELDRGDDPRAAALRERLAADPDDVEALLALGDMSVRRRAYAEAKGFYLHAAKVAPQNLEARTHLGTVAYFLGDPDEALHHYRQALALDPDYTVALFEMGAVLRFGKEDLAGAVATWEHFLRLDPDAPEAARIRELVAEARRLIAAGHTGAPAARPQAAPAASPEPAPADPASAPWPGEPVGKG